MGDVVARAARWAEERPEVHAVLVVGSYAYGRPRMGSDVDLLVLTDRLEQHLTDLSLARSVAPRGRLVRAEQWGPMHERRLRLPSGLLVELGLATPAWAGLPLDAGTARVLSDGCRIVVDRGLVADALAALGRPALSWHPPA